MDKSPEVPAPGKAPRACEHGFAGHTTEHKNQNKLGSELCEGLIQEPSERAPAGGTCLIWGAPVWVSLTLDTWEDLTFPAEIWEAPGPFLGVLDLKV